MVIQSTSVDRTSLIAPSLPKTKSVSIRSSATKVSSRGMTPYLQMKLKTQLSKELLQRVLIKQYIPTEEEITSNVQQASSQKGATSQKQASAAYHSMTFSRQAKISINAAQNKRNTSLEPNPVVDSQQEPSALQQTRNSLRQAIPDYEGLNKTVTCMTKSGNLINSRDSSPSAAAQAANSSSLSTNKVANKILKHVLQKTNGSRNKTKNNIKVVQSHFHVTPLNRVSKPQVRDSC